MRAGISLLVRLDASWSAASCYIGLSAVFAAADPSYQFLSFPEGSLILCGR